MARSARDQIREFALGLPSAIEDFPWGEPVVKIDEPLGRRWGNGLVYGPMFLWLGRPEAQAVSVKLRGSYDEARSVAHATPMTVSGLGKFGWLTVPLEDADLGLVRDWVEESYRTVAPRRFLAGLPSLSQLRQ